MPLTIYGRYDEVDAVYASSRHVHKDRSKRYWERQQLDRQPSNHSSGLSRQDSGVSSQSSRSQIESDSASRISAALTQHSSDSGSSGHQLSRQESDTASSYCSRSSMASTMSTCKYIISLGRFSTGSLHLPAAKVPHVPVRCHLLHITCHDNSSFKQFITLTHLISIMISLIQDVDNAVA